MLARALPRVPVIADARRVRAAARSLEIAPDVSLFLLDDGFSHVGLSRDADVVLLDATAPDAGGALLPAGRLREPLAALARADLIVVTRCEEADPAAAAALVARHAPGVPLYAAETEVLGLSGPPGVPVRATDLRGVPFVAVAGIARPGAFERTIASLGLSPVTFLAYPDHVRYGPAEIGRIVRAAEASGAGAVLTTEKDAVKLETVCPIPLYTVAVRMKVLEPAFVSDLLALLSRRPS